MSRKRSFANHPTPLVQQTPWTFLASSVNSSVTTFPLSAALASPPSDDFDILIGDYNTDDPPKPILTPELARVTAGNAGTSWTVTRGTEGSTASAHAAGAAIWLIETKDGHEQNPGVKTTIGDMDYLGASGVMTRIPAGLDGQYLQYASGLPVPGYIDASHLPDLSSAYVPTTRTVNGVALSSNITLTASDVGALSSTLPGADTRLLFNDGGSLGADARLTYNKAGAGTFVIGSASPTSTLANFLGIGFADPLFFMSAVETTLAHRGTGSVGNGCFNAAASIVATVAPTTADSDFNIYAAQVIQTITPDTTAQAVNWVYGQLVNNTYAGQDTGATLYGQTVSVNNSAPVLALRGTESQVILGANATNALGAYYSVAVNAGVTVPTVTGFYNNTFLFTGAVVTDVYGVYFAKTAQASATNWYGIWHGDLAGAATNPYYFWADSQGVYRIREDNAADGGSNPQAIPSLYNPRFTKYTAGAANFERSVEQWVANVLQIGTEAGGTGTLRAVNLIGASIQANGVAVVTTSGSQALSNKTGNISQWTNDSGYLTSVTAHNLLSATHGDTLADSVVRGDILYGNSTPKWARLAKPSVLSNLSHDGTDVSWVTATGTGAPVRATSATLVTPTLGVASATSINKLTITAPSSSATLTIADGKTFSVNHSLTLAGTDSTTMTFPTTSATLARTDAGNTFVGNQSLGGTSASFPMLVQNGATLEIKKADNSGWTTLKASDFTASSGAYSGSNSMTIGVGDQGADRFLFKNNGFTKYFELAADATNTLGIRRDANAQKIRIYNTWTTTATAGEWWKQDWQTTANQFRMGAVKGSSSGTARVSSWDYGGTEASPSAAITVPITSGAITFGGPVAVPASSTSLASLNVPHGTAPTSPVDGDLWTTTTGLFVRINGVTVGPLS